MSAKATRQSFGQAIVRLAESNPNIVVMDADLGKSTMTGDFAQKFPDRYFELGIAEHNLIGTAAGLAMAGKIPFITSFACFLVGRYETIRMSVSYANTNVKMVGTHAGVGIGEDGNSQMGLEDIALLRSLPNMVLLQPADDIEAQQAVEWAARHQGPVYLRLTRQKLDPVHAPNYQFQMGKADVLLAPKESVVNQLAVFATGGVVGNALKAVQALRLAGKSVTLVNVHTIKPIDKDLILKLASAHKKFVSVEDHYTIGGLGSAISEVLSDAGSSVALHRHGMEVFGESGIPEELYEKFGFSASKLQQLFESLI